DKARMIPLAKRLAAMGYTIYATLGTSTALRNAARWTGKRPEEIAALATTVPARLAGLADRKGALLPGMDADIAIFDERFDVQAAFVGGALVYAAAGFEAAH
ncbi:MAG TPA: amidohydrolase family protein, partial [bacterium]|nr:amidohydrolase family protein [bacterium]